jgi:lysozyme family protein
VQSSFAPTSDFTLAAESAQLSLRRDDPGNWTGNMVGAGILIGSKFGVSAARLADYLGRAASSEDMDRVTKDVATAIFGAGYWNTVNGDLLPAGIDLMTADHGYNRGATTAAMLLQRLVGATPDGWIGRETLTNLFTFRPGALKLSLVDPRALQEAACVAQDGRIGPETMAALGQLAPAHLAIGCLYAAQVRDYHTLAAASANPGWFVRARNRWTAALALIKAPS